MIAVNTELLWQEFPYENVLKNCNQTEILCHLNFTISSTINVVEK